MPWYSLNWVSSLSYNSLSQMSSGISKLGISVFAASASFQVDLLYWSSSRTQRIDRARSSSSILWCSARSLGLPASPTLTSTFSVSWPSSLSDLISLLKSLIFRQSTNLVSMVLDSSPLSRLFFLLSKFSMSCFIELINFSLFFIFSSSAWMFQLFTTRDTPTLFFFLCPSSTDNRPSITLRVSRMRWFSDCSSAICSLEQSVGSLIHLAQLQTMLVGGSYPILFFAASFILLNELVQLGNQPQSLINSDFVSFQRHKSQALLPLGKSLLSNNIMRERTKERKPTLKNYLKICQAKRVRDQQTRITLNRTKSAGRMPTSQSAMRTSETRIESESNALFKEKIDAVRNDVVACITDVSTLDEIFELLDQMGELYEQNNQRLKIQEEVFTELKIPQESRIRFSSMNMILPEEVHEEAIGIKSHQKYGSVQQPLRQRGHQS